MLTPQDITNREFDKAVFGGYDIAAVDKFLEEIFQDYSALYRDNATLKSKLKVLVDKVEEYRNTEDAMRLALLTAQKTARELTEDAEKKSAEILAEARTRADALLEQAERDAEDRRLELKEGLRVEENALQNAKRKTAAYLEDLHRAGETLRESLTQIYAFAEPLEEPQPAVREPAEEPEPEPEPEAEDEPVPEPDLGISVDEVARMIESSFDKPVGQPAAEESEEDHSLRIDYDNLKFGDGYSKNKKL
ncbi:MAG: DivIVA domain-containing protein [Oscillospiraceae bacterium]|nr:DivIVA domain-containing protein [Oscillospiraceae bacterium]